MSKSNVAQRLMYVIAVGVSRAKSIKKTMAQMHRNNWRWKTISASLSPVKKNHIKRVVLEL